MNIKTNLKGRLRNTSLAFHNGLMPLFEAVVNSIHGVDEAELNPIQGEINVEIIRSPQLALDVTKKPGPDACGDILGFKITDNGIGFNDANLISFEELDSEHKAAIGCRGVGRLLWLKAFRKAAIHSVYEDDSGAFKSRDFTFDAKNGVSEIKENGVSSEKRVTTIHLDGFGDKYRKASKKTTTAIANSLFEHCLWYFVRDGGVPKIIVRDDDERVLLEDIYNTHMLSSAKDSSIEIKGNKFNLTHVKLRSSSHSHGIAFCAANRLVVEENITGKIPGLYGKLSDENGDFTYVCYVSSEYLDTHVRPERTGFDIEEEIEGMFDNQEISFGKIREAIVSNVSSYLAEHLEENKKESRERIENFASNVAPRYRPILSRIPDEKLNVDPHISDKDLDVFLHRHLSDIERDLIEQGHNIMKPGRDEDYPDYQRRVQGYLETAEDIKKSDLANYVSHRKVVLDLLERALKKNEDGKYEREELIHRLIMPMRVDSGQVMSDGCNLWLIDERLAFHDYLASDKTLLAMPITGSEEAKEPDLCALNIFDTPLLVAEEKYPPLASIVVVEIKRPMRNDAKAGEDKDPIEQALGYLERVRKGGVQTASGRPIAGSDRIPGFCYVLCDITSSIEQRCKLFDAIRTSDGMGYFFYNKTYEAYVEVISFDGLVKAAKERNRAFFDKLGLPSS